MAALSGFKRTINSQDHFVATALPRGWKRDGSRPAVLVIPGTEETFTFPYLPTKGQQMVDQIVQAGYPAALFQCSANPAGIGDLWANDSAYSYIDAMRTYMQSPEIGARSGKVVLVGLSQGALNVLAYAGRYPANVAGVQAYLPNTSLAATKANSGYTAAVNAAYGGNYTDAAYGAQHSPEIQMNAATNPYTMPINLVYASDDPVIPFSYPNAFASTVNGRTGANNVALINGGAVGHDWAVTWTNATVRNALLALLAAA